MKNRKLFAIITLVAFMLTMMPVMAFGAATAAGASIEMDIANAETDTMSAKFTATKGKYLEGTVTLVENYTDSQQIMVVALDSNGSIADDVFVKVGKNFDGSGSVDNTTVTNQAGWGISTVGDGKANEVKFYAVSATEGVEVTFKAFILDATGAAPTTRIEAWKVVNGTFDKTIYNAIDASATGTIGEVKTDMTVDVTIDKGADNMTVAGGGTFASPKTGAKADNGLTSYKVTVVAREGAKLYGNASVSVSFDRVGVSTNKTDITTNAGGKAEFKVYASKEDTYKMRITVNGKSVDRYLNFGNVGAASATFTQVSTDTFAVGEKAKNILTIQAVDALGNNIVTPDINNSDAKLIIEVVDAPKGSVLLNKKTVTKAVTSEWGTDLSTKKLAYSNNKVSFVPDKEGSYTFKIYNATTGVSDTAVVKAAKFGEVDHITVAYDSASYALGETTGAAKVKAVDAAGVVKEITTGLSWSYAGVGVAKFNTDNAGTIEFLSNATYAGQKIVVTVVYNDAYIATTELTVGVQPANIVFTDATAKAGAETTVKGQLVDLNGNSIALSAASTYTVNAIVVAKPEGALVEVATSVSGYGLGQTFKSKGAATMKVTSNKEGIVKVNVIVAVNSDGVGAVEYYVAGTATVNFGGVATVDTIPDSIVNMIIGANTVIADGKASASPVAPFIENGRTFVPVRAFAEATGATVNYDAATQVITIKAKGVDAQMTVGSNVMTVNGETVVMDAAAKVIGEGYTVLPVRYAGQALGYSFDVAYGANGAVTAVTMTK